MQKHGMIKLGTRSSKLAMWQTHHVQAQLHEGGHTTDIVEISTQGDRVQNVPLHQMNAVGIFTKALDEALQKGEVDAAVHSAKDLPSQLDDDLEIVAFLKREDPRDVLVAMRPEVHFENLTQPWVIGTSSVRRQALLHHYLPEIKTKDIRGNVDTRLAKLEQGEYDGIILAMAGLKRLGLASHVRQKLNTSTFTPAVGQGAIAVVVHQDSAHKETLRNSLNHLPTQLAVETERSFLRTLQGGCHTPAFAFANVVGDTISLMAGMAHPETGELKRVELQGPTHTRVQMGHNAAQEVLTYLNA